MSSNQPDSASQYVARELKRSATASGALNRAAEEVGAAQAAIMEAMGVKRYGQFTQSYANRSTLPAAPNSVRSVADLGSLVLEARKQAKMSQQRFADAAGVGRRFLSELENGKPSLEFDKVLKCAQAAGIDILAKSRRLR